MRHCVQCYWWVNVIVVTSAIRFLSCTSKLRSRKTFASLIEILSSKTSFNELNENYKTSLLRLSLKHCVQCCREWFLIRISSGFWSKARVTNQFSLINRSSQVVFDQKSLITIIRTRCFYFIYTRFLDLYFTLLHVSNVCHFKYQIYIISCLKYMLFRVSNLIVWLLTKSRKTKKARYFEFIITRFLDLYLTLLHVLKTY